MSIRAVYDAMVFFQWASLPPERSHASAQAVKDGTVKLCLSSDSLNEVKELLHRPAIQEKSPNLTDDRIKRLLEEIRDNADWFETVPRHFSYPRHPKDDHILNLAIESKARFLVTWESRIRKLGSGETEEAKHFKALAPTLEIVTPAELAERLKFPETQDPKQ